MHEEFLAGWLAGWLGLFQSFTQSDTLVEFLAFAKSFERWSSGSIRRKGLFSLSFAKWKAAVVAAGVVVAVAAAGVVVVAAASLKARLPFQVFDWCKPVQLCSSSRLVCCSDFRKRDSGSAGCAERRLARMLLGWQSTCWSVTRQFCVVRLLGWASVGCCRLCK